MSKGTTDAEWRKVTQEYAARFLKLAEQNPSNPASIEALTWVIEHGLFTPRGARAVDLLIKDHLRSKDLAPIARYMAFYGGADAEKLFRAAITGSPDRETAAWSHFGLGPAAQAEDPARRAGRG
jgi:hypothetical protein